MEYRLRTLREIIDYAEEIQDKLGLITVFPRGEPTVRRDV